MNSIQLIHRSMCVPDGLSVDVSEVKSLSIILLFSPVQADHSLKCTSSATAVLIATTLYTCASTDRPSYCMYACCTSHSSKCILVTFTDVSFPFFHRECCALVCSYICKYMDGGRGVVGMGLHGAP